MDRVRSVLEIRDECNRRFESFLQVESIELRDDTPILTQLETAVEEWRQSMEVRRSERLAPFARDIERICGEHGDLLGHSGGFVAGFSRSLRREAFRNALENYVVRNARIPEGEVETDGVGDFRVRDT